LRRIVVANRSGRLNYVLGRNLCANGQILLFRESLVVTVSDIEALCSRN
jgi:hypothetical protein